MFSFPMCRLGNVGNCMNNCSHDIPLTDKYESVIGVVVPSSLNVIQVADINDISTCISLCVSPHLTAIKQLENTKSVMTLVSYFRSKVQAHYIVSSATVYVRKDCDPTPLISQVMKKYSQQLLDLRIFSQHLPSLHWKFPHHTQQDYLTKMENHAKGEVWFPVPDPNKQHPHWTMTATLKGGIINAVDVMMTIQTFCTFINELSDQEKTLIITNNEDSTKHWLSLLESKNTWCVNAVEDLNLEKLQTSHIVLVSSLFLHTKYQVFLQTVLKDKNVQSEEQLYECNQRQPLGLSHSPLSLIRWNRVIFQDVLKYFKNPHTWFKTDFKWGMTKYTKFHVEIVTIHRFVVALLQFCYGLGSSRSYCTVNLSCPTIRFLLENCIFRFDQADFIPCVGGKMCLGNKWEQVHIQPGDWETTLFDRLNRKLPLLSHEIFWLDPLHVINQEDILETRTADEFYEAYIHPLLEQVDECQHIHHSNLAKLQRVYAEILKIVKYIQHPEVYFTQELITNLQDFINVTHGNVRSRRPLNKEVHDLLSSLFQMHVRSLSNRVQTTKEGETLLKIVKSRRNFANHQWKEQHPQNCMICFEAPAVICLTTCLHLFCKDCLLIAEPNNVKTCPCCKTLCHASELTRINFENKQESVINLHTMRPTAVMTWLTEELDERHGGANLLIFSTICAARVCAHLLKKKYGSKVFVWKHQEQEIAPKPTIILTGLVKEFSLTMILPRFKKVIIFNTERSGDQKKTLQCHTLVKACPFANVKTVYTGEFSIAVKGEEVVMDCRPLDNIASHLD